MRYPKVVEALKNMGDDDLRCIVSSAVSWDGTFCESEIDVYDLDSIVDLFYGDRDSIVRLVELMLAGKPNLSDEYFYFSCEGIESTDHIPFEDYYDKIANWLVDNAGGSGFPDYWCLSEELIEAVAEAANIEPDDL